MDRGIYRPVLLFLTAWCALVIGDTPGFAVDAFKSPNILIRVQMICFALGFAVVPIITVGLWRERLWGMWGLVIATLLVFASAVPNRPIRMAALHLLPLAFVGLHYFLRLRSRRRDLNDRTTDLT